MNKKQKKRSGTTLRKSLTAREANAHIRGLLADCAPEISRRMVAPAQAARTNSARL
jgi:hypothetical protein